MNIDSLGDETIDQLYQQELIRGIDDIYRLKNKELQLLQLERFGSKSVMNLIQGIEKSKEVPFEKVLFALGIRYVGETVAKKLAYSFRSIDALMKASFEELIAVDEIGERIAQSILNYFAKEEHIELIYFLKAEGLQFEAIIKEVVLEGDQLSGKTFLISGVFEKFSRDELKEKIEKNGGKILSSISSKLNYLVAGENMGPSKLQKAQSLNIPIISDEELIKMIESTNS